MIERDSLVFSERGVTIIININRYWDTFTIRVKITDIVDA